MSRQDQDITLHIATPNGQFEATFPKTTTVAEVIAQVRVIANLAPDATFELWTGETRLQPENRPLVSFHLSDPAEVTLLATGSGV